MAAVDPVSGLAVPSIGNSYFVTSTEKDTGSFAESVEPQLVSAGSNPDHSHWLVSVKYGPYDANQFPSDPTLWPIKLAWGSQKYERAEAKDKDGNPVKNSAGDPFGDPLTVDDSRSLITVEGDRPKREGG